MKNIISFLFLFISTFIFAQQEFYELRTYEMKYGGNGNALHSYLKDAYIPASKRNGVLSVGVFNEYSMSNPAKVYVLTVY